MTLRLHTVVASTRPGRVGISVGRWFNEAAQAHGGFDAHLVDLAHFNLPVFDEPNHPRTKKYEHAHTKAWSQSVEMADAFVFVTPEYNYGPPPSLINALTFLSLEWNYKPAGFVSYGGVSGGLRAVQAAKLITSSLKLVSPPEGVAIPMVGTMLDENRNFKSNDLIDLSVKQLLDELMRWAPALKTIRG